MSHSDRGKKPTPGTTTWRTWFVSSKRLATQRPVFELKDTHADLDSYDGYLGGHPVLDRLIERCRAAGFKERHLSSDSPFNVATYETIYECFDGGLLIYAGNYDSEDNDEKPIGAFVIGNEAFNWALSQLVLEPRRSA